MNERLLPKQTLRTIKEIVQARLHGFEQRQAERRRRRQAPGRPKREDVEQLGLKWERE